jgi:hypothetical protein
MTAAAGAHRRQIVAGFSYLFLGVMHMGGYIPGINVPGNTASSLIPHAPSPVGKRHAGCELGDRLKEVHSDKTSCVRGAVPVPAYFDANSHHLTDHFAGVHNEPADDYLDWFAPGDLADVPKQPGCLPATVQTPCPEDVLLEPACFDANSPHRTDFASAHSTEPADNYLHWFADGDLADVPQPYRRFPAAIKPPWAGDAVVAQAFIDANNLQLTPPFSNVHSDGQWRKGVRMFAAGDLAEVPEQPQFSDKFLDGLLDSLPDKLVDDFVNSSWDFHDGVADLIDFFSDDDSVPNVPAVVDFLGLDDGGQDLTVFSTDGVPHEDTSGPTFTLIDFLKPADRRAIGLPEVWENSIEEFEVLELMTEEKPELQRRIGSGPANDKNYLASGVSGVSGRIADKEIPTENRSFSAEKMEEGIGDTAIAREAARISSLILNSPPELIHAPLEREVFPYVPQKIFTDFAQSQFKSKIPTKSGIPIPWSAPRKNGKSSPKLAGTKLSPAPAQNGKLSARSSEFKSKIPTKSGISIPWSAPGKNGKSSPKLAGTKLSPAPAQNGKLSGKSGGEMRSKIPTRSGIPIPWPAPKQKGVLSGKPVGEIRSKIPSSTFFANRLARSINLKSI